MAVLLYSLLESNCRKWCNAGRQALFAPLVLIAPLVPIAPLHVEEVVDIDRVLWEVTSRTTALVHMMWRLLESFVCRQESLRCIPLCSSAFQTSSYELLSMISLGVLCDLHDTQAIGTGCSFVIQFAAADQFYLWHVHMSCRGNSGLIGSYLHVHFPNGARFPRSQG